MTEKEEEKWAGKGCLGGSWRVSNKGMVRPVQHTFTECSL